MTIVLVFGFFCHILSLVRFGCLFYNIAHNAVYPFFGQYNWNECHDKHFILVVVFVKCV